MNIVLRPYRQIVPVGNTFGTSRSGPSWKTFEIRISTFTGKPSSTSLFYRWHYRMYCDPLYSTNQSVKRKHAPFIKISLFYIWKEMSNLISIKKYITCLFLRYRNFLKLLSQTVNHADVSGSAGSLVNSYVVRRIIFFTLDLSSRKASKADHKKWHKVSNHKTFFYFIFSISSNMWCHFEEYEFLLALIFFISHDLAMKCNRVICADISSKILRILIVKPTTYSDFVILDGRPWISKWKI